MNFLKGTWKDFCEIDHNFYIDKLCHDILSLQGEHSLHQIDDMQCCPNKEGKKGGNKIVTKMAKEKKEREVKAMAVFSFGETKELDCFNEARPLCLSQLQECSYEKSSMNLTWS